MHCRIATAAAAQHSSQVPSLDQRLSEIEARLEEFEGQPELQSAGRTEGSDQNWRVFAASLRQNIFDHVNAIEAKLHVLKKDTRVSLFKVADFVDEARIDLNARVANPECIPPRCEKCTLVHSVVEIFRGQSGMLLDRVRSLKLRRSRGWDGSERRHGCGLRAEDR